jgi:PAS domain S-box-containing protein
MVIRLPQNRTATLLTACALLLAITCSLFAVNDVNEGLGFLFAVPIAIVASRFGRAHGLVTAGGAFALFVTWTEANDVELHVSGYTVRAVTYVFVAVIVGGYAERFRRLSGMHGRLVESAPDAILSVDARGCIELANEKASELFGWPAEELVGMTVEKLMPTRFRTSHVEQRRAYAAAPRTREMGQGFPLYGVRRDGTEFRVEITLAPSQEARGSVTAIIRDVTRQKLLEEELKRAGRFFRVSRDLVCTIDANGCFTDVGTAWEEALGSSAEDLSGRSLVEICHPADRSAVQRELEALASGTSGVRFTSRCRGADGTWLWFEWSAIGVPEDRTVYASARDVTEAVEMQATLHESRRELRRSNEELEQFARVASHDLSEPLRVIGGYGGLLKRQNGAALAPQSQRHLDAMLVGVDRLQSMLDALLAYSRVGGSSAARALVDTETAVRLAWDAVAESVQERGAVLELDSLPVADCDGALVGQLFQNLMSNALRFVEQDPPRLAVTCEANDADWLFSVEDNGPGIEPDDAERIFRPFERVHGRERPGTGMGLAICARIVEKHGGRIWVEPGREGGSAFRFTLPKVQFTAHASGRRGGAGLRPRRQLELSDRARDGSGGGAVPWKLEAHRRPSARRGLGPDGAAVGLHDRAGDGQP